MSAGARRSGLGDLASGRSLAFWAALFVLALLVAVGAGAVVGAVMASPGPQPYESEPQTEVLKEQGHPDQWLVADGPIKPGGAVHRVETWIYGDGETAHYFKWIDGVLIEEGTATAQPYGRDPALPAPNLLHGGMKIDDVIEVLGEEPEYIPFDDATFELSLAYLFEDAQLVVTFYNDRLLTAQTW